MHILTLLIILQKVKNYIHLGLKKKQTEKKYIEN